MVDVAKLIHESLRELRNAKGISRSVLSRMTAREGDLGVSEGTIEQLETIPGRIPTARVLEALARCLEVEPDYFYEWPIAAAAADRPVRPSVGRRATSAAQRLHGTRPASPGTRRAAGDKDPGP